jgi:S1-C subfamily serine protease
MSDNTTRNDPAGNEPIEENIDSLNNRYLEEVNGYYPAQISGQYAGVNENKPATAYTGPVYAHNTPSSPPKNESKVKAVLTATGTAMLLTLLGLMSFMFVSMAGNTATGAATVPASSSASAFLLSSGSSTTTNSTVQLPVLSVAQVAQSVTPAVVQVTNEQAVTASRTGRTGSTSSQGSGTTQAVGVGTGIIYDKAGYILTNNHVIEGATSLLVTLTDGSSYKGTLVGADPQTDLAVIKIEASGTLPVATLGNSSELQVGDGLVAIGNALDLPGGPTVTAGVVSALDRSVAEPSSTGGNNPFAASTSTGPQLYGLIQTDAAINPGNSGGPLINMAGQVVGINTLGAGTDSSGVQIQGIGFAISINQAKDIAQQLVTKGSVTHAYLGIGSEPLTAAIATSLGVPATQGAVIDQVQSGSAAAQAGLQQSDVITAIDGTRLTGESTLGQIINQHQPGDKVSLTVITPASSGGTGVARTVEVTLGTQSAN